MFTTYSEERAAELNATEDSTDVAGITVLESKPWTSSDPFFTADTRDLIKTVFKCYVRQFIIFLGIPGNIISCIVFFKQGLSDRIHLLLFWLAVADLLHLMVNVLAVCSCYFSDRVLTRNWSTLYNAKMNHVLSWFSVSSGALMTVMSVDRCLSVAMPIKARRLLTYRPLVAAIFLSYLLPFAFYVTIIMGHTVKWRIDPSTNRSMAYETDTPWFPEDSRIRALTSFRLITKSLFLGGITIGSIITIGYLHKAALDRSKMARSVKEKGDTGENRTTKMLLFLCVLFALILALEMSCSVSHMVFPEFNLYRKYHNSLVVVYQILVFPALCLNSAVNFFAYLVLSSRFRSHLKGLFRSFHGRRHAQDHIKGR